MTIWICKLNAIIPPIGRERGLAIRINFLGNLVDDGREYTGKPPTVIVEMLK
jgi:hypothetical protein